jgi:hypothetical protein
MVLVPTWLIAYLELATSLGLKDGISTETEKCPDDPGEAKKSSIQ